MRARVAIATLLLATACSQAASTSTPQRAAPTATASSPTPAQASAAATGVIADWPTYHGSNDRAGSTTTAALRPPLHVAWRTPMDAALYAQPIVAGGLVVAATENDTVYAVEPATGHVRWRRHLDAPARRADLPCGNIDPSGITGTPAYDAATHLVFVVTENHSVRHTLVALDARSGEVAWRRDVDVASGRDRAAEQERAAVLAAGGRVYVAFGGRFGDCGNYVGYVASVSTSGTGAVTRYEVPTRREAGMWAAPGPVVGPGGAVYVASGNGAEVGGRYDGSDSVIRLSPSLSRTALFAPSTWRQDNAQDLDLGSMSPVPVGGRIVIAGKRGTVYLLTPDLKQVATTDGCAAYGGAAAHGDVVLMPCSDGVRALQVTGDRLRWLWRTSDVVGSPVVAGDAVYGFGDGALVELALRDGKKRASVGVGDVTRFMTPAPVGRYVFVGTKTHLVAVTGTG